MTTTTTNYDETIERFLELDRHSGLGRLAGGVVHALNNSLAVAFGQVDLMMINPAAQGFKEEFETILGSFEEGSRLTGSLMLVTNSMQNGSEDLGQVFVALAAILSRIYKRDQVKVTTDLNPDLKPVKNPDKFSQAIFHAVSLGLKTARQAELGKRTLICRLLPFDGKIRLEVELKDLTFTPFPEAIKTAIFPPSAASVQYHSWFIEKLCIGNGIWNVKEDAKILYIDWD